MLLIFRNEPLALLFFVITIDNDPTVARMLCSG
jgi:hypothetical protein